jgi:hypothetical protein
VLAYQYLQTLPQLAQAAGNTFWVIPSEVTTALRSLSTAFGPAEGTSPPEGRPARPAGPGRLAAAAAALSGDAVKAVPAANGEPAGPAETASPAQEAAVVNGEAAKAVGAQESGEPAGDVRT